MKTSTRTRLALALLCGWVPLTAPADILAPNMNVKDTIGRVDSMHTEGGLTAQFWLTSDEQIFSGWARTGAIRDLKPTVQVKRNTPLFLALFLVDPGVRTILGAGGKPTRNANVSFDLYVINPNGVLCLANKARVAWKGEPPPPGLINLARDRGVISFEAIDPLGQYTVIVIVHDNIRHIDMKLSRRLELID
jgi:hypothetical protein